MKKSITTNLSLGKFKESLSSKYKNSLNIKMKLTKKQENKAKTSSRCNTQRVASSRTILNPNKFRNDKVEKKLYLENINMKNDINKDLLSKLSSTFRSFNYQSIGNDSKIESNLFNIGAKRSFLFRKSMNSVRNMIQDFDNQFSMHLEVNDKENKEQTGNNIYNNYNKNYKTKQIKEESYSDYDFNINKTGNSYSINNKDINNKILINSKNFFDETKKGKKYLKNEESIKTKLKNEKKIIGLNDAFKYYELFYNYKYLLTEKDILCLSFNRRKKLEKNNHFKYYLKSPRMKLDTYNEKCEKCKKNSKLNKFKYKNNLNIHLLTKNFSDFNKSKINKIFKTELNSKNRNKNENIYSESNKIMKRALSGYNNSKYKYSNTITRATSSSTNKMNKFNNKINYNIISSSKQTYLNLSNISSNSQSIVPSTPKIPKTKPQNILSVKHKIRNLSKNIISNADKLKTLLKDTININVMKIIKDENQPVKKVNKKVKINIDKIRTDLNLKRRGKGINEYKLIMDNVDKLYKSLPKTHVDLMRSIAKIVINEDRRKNKPLIYNDTHDNRLFKERFKKEMFEASSKMNEIRKSLNKHKIEKPFEEKLKRLLKDDVFMFFNIKSLKDEINKIRVLRGEIIKNEL